MSPKIFFSIFNKNVVFSEKLLNEKIFQTSFPIKKIIFIFVAERPLPFKRDLGRRNCGFAIFSENTAFFENTAK